MPCSVFLWRGQNVLLCFLMDLTNPHPDINNEWSLIWIGFRWRTETEQKIYLKPEKTADISDATFCHPAKRCLKNKHKNSILMTCKYPDVVYIVFWLVKANFPCGMPDQWETSDTSLVWNMCSRCSDVSWRENQWWHREMLVVLLG